MQNVREIFDYLLHLSAVYIWSAKIDIIMRLCLTHKLESQSNVWWSTYKLYCIQNFVRVHRCFESFRSFERALRLCTVLLHVHSGAEELICIFSQWHSVHMQHFSAQRESLANQNALNNFRQWLVTIRHKITSIYGRTIVVYKQCIGENFTFLKWGQTKKCLDFAS